MKLFCWLGLHSWISESAMFTHGHQCRRCGKWKGGDNAVAREREAWDRVRTATSETDTIKLTPLVLRELMKDGN